MIRKENGGWNEIFKMIVMFGLYLLEVQGDLGFQVAQVAPEDPAIKIIIITTSIANAPTDKAVNQRAENNYFHSKFCFEFRCFLQKI